MKEYPSIPYKGDKSIRKVIGKIPFYLFEKLDGTNIRSEWSDKRGFYKFGTRKGLFGETHKLFGSAIGKIKEQEEVLSEIFREARISRATAFFEFLGESSFAGWHDTREEQECILFDVFVDKKGFIPPKDFIKTFEGKVDIPEVVYHGYVDDDILQQINDGTLYGMSREGVVCKAANAKSKGDTIMFKIKSQEWYDRVRKEGKDAD